MTDPPPCEAMVLAIDPGPHLGYSVCKVYRDPKSFSTTQFIQGWGMQPVIGGTFQTPHDNLYAAAQELLSRVHSTFLGQYPSTGYTRLYCVIEQFVITRKSMQDNANSLATIELIGAIKAMIALGHPEFQVVTHQGPEDAHTVSNSVLTELTLKSPRSGQTVHELMAQRHAVLFTSRLRQGAVSRTYDELSGLKTQKMRRHDTA